MTLLSKLRAALILIALAVAAPATAQTVSVDDSASIRLMKIDHVSIGVRDLDRVAIWYRDKLDFVVEKVWTVDGLDGVRLAYLVGHGWRIELIEGGAGPFPKPPEDFNAHFQRGGYGHLAFLVEDVDETMKALTARGVETFVPPTSYPVGAERRVAFIMDPEGNVIEFAAPIPSVD